MSSISTTNIFLRSLPTPSLLHTLTKSRHTHSKVSHQRNQDYQKNSRMIIINGDNAKHKWKADFFLKMLNKINGKSYEIAHE